MVLPPEDTTWPLPRTERVRQCSWCYQKVRSINDKRTKLFFLQQTKRFSLKSCIAFMSAQKQIKLSLKPNKVYNNFFILKLNTFIHINDFLYPVL